MPSWENGSQDQAMWNKIAMARAAKQQMNVHHDGGFSCWEKHVQIFFMWEYNYYFLKAYIKNNQLC